jgi:hypothetical protein
VSGGRSLTPPERIDVVPADAVGALIERADREFAQLEEHARRAVAEAERLEERATAEGVDPKASAWTMLRLQRFLDQLREEARRDADATVEVARRRAQVIVRGANGDGGSDLPPGWDDFLAVAAPPPNGPESLVRRLPEPLPQLATPPLVEPVVAARSAFASPEAPGASSPGMTPLGERPSPGGAVGARPAAAPGAQLPASEGSLPAPARPGPSEPTSSAGSSPMDGGGPTPTAESSAPVPPLTMSTNGHAASEGTGAASLPASPPSDVDDMFDGLLGPAPVTAAVEPMPRPKAVAATAAPADRAGARPSTEKPPKRRLLGRLPLSALLEVVAVLLILVFILLRLS